MPFSVFSIFLSCFFGKGIRRPEISPAVVNKCKMNQPIRLIDSVMLFFHEMMRFLKLFLPLIPQPQMLIRIGNSNFLLNSFNWRRSFAMFHRTDHFLHEILIVRHGRYLFLELLDICSLLRGSQHGIDQFQNLVLIDQLSIFLSSNLIVNDFA